MNLYPQSRWKSWVAWQGLVSLIALIVKDIYGYELPHLDLYMEMFLSIMVGFGVLNNPTDKERF